MRMGNAELLFKAQSPSLHMAAFPIRLMFTVLFLAANCLATGFVQFLFSFFFFFPQHSTFPVHVNSVLIILAVS